MNPEGHKLFVGDLPHDVTKEELTTVFSHYGEVTNIHLMHPHPRSGHRCALLFYSTLESANDAIKVLHGVYKIREDADNPIKVAFAKDKEDKGKGENKGRGKGDNHYAVAEKASEAEGHKLFVGGLPLDVKEDELQTVFSTYGEVMKIHIMSPHAQSGRVAAFVFYAAPEAADDAIKVLDNQYKIRVDAEQPIRVAWAVSKEKGEKGGGRGKNGNSEVWDTWQDPYWNWGVSYQSNGNGKGGGQGGHNGKHWGEPEPSKVKNSDGWKLFIGGLPKDVSQDELETVFSTYGEVAKVHVMAPHNVSGRVAAFIFYQSEQGAEDAIKVLDGQYKIREDAEAPIQVRWADEKKNGKDEGGKGSWKGSKEDPWWNGKGGKGGNGKNSYGWQEDAWGWPEWNEKSTWRSTQWQEPQQQSWGQNKKGGKAKGAEWGNTNGKTKGSSKGAANSAEKGSAEKKGGGSGGKGADANGGAEADTKLFVGNLPEDVTEEALNYVFGTYGKVVHVHIMTGKSKTGQACAFVELSNVIEADTAIATLNDKYEIRPGHGPIAVKKAKNNSR